MTGLEQRLKTDVLGGAQVRLGSTEFAEAYEAAVLDLRRPTKAQQKVIEECAVALRRGQSQRADGPPGAGKTYVGLALLLRFLEMSEWTREMNYAVGAPFWRHVQTGETRWDVPPQEKILLVVRSAPLAYFIAKWICWRHAHEPERWNDLLSRLHVLCEVETTAAQEASSSTASPP